MPRLNLTTMRMKFEQLGREAYLMVRRICDGEHVPVGVKTVIPTELIERGSVREIND